MTADDVEGSGTPTDPWQLSTPPGSSSYEAYRDPDADPPAPLAAAIPFYQKQLPTLGWQSADAGDIGDTAATLDFQKGSQQMVVSLTSAANVTSVSIFVNHAEP